MSRRIRAVEHRCVAGLAGAHSGLQDRILLNYTTGLPTCLHQKKPDLLPKKQDSSFKAYTHKACTTTHKTDIKARQKHRYITSPIFFPEITLSCICFLSITYIVFRATEIFLQYSVPPYIAARDF